MPGVFFSFDGVDGVGKTTQMEQFCAWLRDRGEEVVQCRDPGGTKLGEALREIVLHKEETPVDAVAEMFIYMASRAQLVSEVIAPALGAGKVVVSDRFLLSNVAYQGHAGGVSVQDVWNVGAVATGGLRPDLTFLLDMPVDQATSRLGDSLDRMEARGVAFQTRVREGFLAEASQTPDEIIVVDAARDVITIQADIQAAAARLFAATAKE
jgi:dTMP kinase